MPIITYHCPGCERSAERIVKRYDDEQHCQRCGHLLTRIISLPAKRNPAYGIQK